jgi:hypothetical protein
MCRKFEWDEGKNQINLNKHGIDFDTASFVFDDPHFLTEQDRVVDGEERWQTIGMVGGFVILMVAHTVQDASNVEIIRIISARRAIPKEKKRYEQAAFR